MKASVTDHHAAGPHTDENQGLAKGQPLFEVDISVYIENNCSPTSFDLGSRKASSIGNRLVSRKTSRLPDLASVICYHKGR